MVILFLLLLGSNSWVNLHAPQPKGGLGFCRMFDFNKALIAKLGWKIATNSNVMRVQILKKNTCAAMIYFWAKLILPTRLRFGGTFSKFVICFLKELAFLLLSILISSLWAFLFSKGTYFPTLANSCLILVSILGFLVSPSLFQKTTDPNNPPNLNHYYVKSFINQSSQSWDEAKLTSIFHRNIVDEILKIHIYSKESSHYKKRQHSRRFFTYIPTLLSAGKNAGDALPECGLFLRR